MPLCTGSAHQHSGRHHLLKRAAAMHHGSLPLGTLFWPSGHGRVCPPPMPPLLGAFCASWSESACTAQQWRGSSGQSHAARLCPLNCAWAMQCAAHDAAHTAGVDALQGLLSCPDLNRATRLYEPLHCGSPRASLRQNLLHLGCLRRFWFEPDCALPAYSTRQEVRVCSLSQMGLVLLLPRSQACISCLGSTCLIMMGG